MPRVMKQADIDNAIKNADAPKKQRNRTFTEYALISASGLLAGQAVTYELQKLGVSDASKIKAAIKTQKLTDGVQYQIVRLGPVFTARNVTVQKTEIDFA